MEKSEKRKTKILNLFLFLYVLSIILSAGTMYAELENLQKLGISDFRFRELSLCIGAVVCIVSFFYYRNFNDKNGVLIFLITAIYLGIYLFFTLNKVKAYLEGFVFPFFISFFICLFNKKLFHKFFDYYTDIVLVISGISLFFFVFGTLLNLIPGQEITYLNNGTTNAGISYFYLSFVNCWQRVNIFGHEIYRNVGIFMEAPGFATPLIITLWWELFGNERKKVLRFLILLFTMITTFSARAYIGFLFIVFIYLYSSRTDSIQWWKKYRWKLFPVLILAGSTVLIIAISLRTKSVIPGHKSSLVLRMEDYVAAFNAWKSKPLTGIGFNNLSELYQFYNSPRNSGDATGGLMNILAFDGIWMFIFYAIPFIYSFCKYRKSDNSLMINTFLFLLLFNLITGAAQYTYFLIFFIGYGYSILQIPSLKK